MLYAHNSQSFQKLSVALAGQNVEDSVIDIAIQYLDTEKDRNNALLDRMPRYNYTVDYSKRTLWSNAIKREILASRNAELKERFILLVQALFGSGCHDLLFMFYDWNEISKKEKDIVKALSSRYGEKAEGCFYAIFLSSITTSYYYNRGNAILQKSPEVCMDAVDFVDGDEKVISILCAMALNQIKLPSGMVERVMSTLSHNPVRDKAIDTIKNIIKENKILKTETYVAVAEGSYFDAELRSRLKSSHGMTFSLVSYANVFVPDISRILNLIANNSEFVNHSYIKSCAETFMNRNEHFDKHFADLAVKQTKNYISAMNALDNAQTAKCMEDILIKANPDYNAKKNLLKEKVQKNISKDLSDIFLKETRADIRKYLLDGGSFADIRPLIEKGNGRFNRVEYHYTEAYGLDDFMKRVITVFSCIEGNYTIYYIQNVFGLNVNKNTAEFVNIIADNMQDSTYVMKTLTRLIDSSFVPESDWLSFALAISERAEEFADVDVTDMSITARWLYVTALATADRDKYKSNILAMTGDTSKKIKEALIKAISVQWHDDVVEMLNSKKVGIRDIAVSVIEKSHDGSYAEDLKKAFEKEKSEKIKSRIAGLIGMKTFDNKTGENSAKVDMVTVLVKGSKGKKVAWLFEEPYKAVHFNDGTEVPVDYLKALLILYSDMPAIAINKTAVDLAGKIEPHEMNDFTIEVFRRWADKGAQAKTKWVMWFCGVHGGHGMTETLMKYIKEWAEHSRGAIASEAVMAMAVNGSSEALMNVDSISRKFKHKQVRNAANNALVDVAEILGLTKEELADRIVPDMNFDENMCRVFDYGERKFNVYLTPELEIEIYNGDKKVKSMPKPSSKDNAEIAGKSYEDFKAMKKQIKNVVANQKQRLEYVLMCDRKWTKENWTNLFVRNPVMHCFAIGLIWGVYSGSELLESFRYMDDGSFTNIQEDEFIIPDNAEIGLVHPIELTDEEKNSWIEQLSDYEITQPFNQLNRQCFSPTEKELDSKEILRFEDKTINNYTLRGKMIKAGWETGIPEDAGFFWYFCRSDETKCIRNADDSVTYEGYYAELKFSGMCIDYMDSEDVTLGELTFKDATNKTLKIKDINKRYFSEIIMQLSSMGNAE